MWQMGNSVNQNCYRVPRIVLGKKMTNVVTDGASNDYSSGLWMTWLKYPRERVFSFYPKFLLIRQ